MKTRRLLTPLLLLALLLSLSAPALAASSELTVADGQLTLSGSGLKATGERYVTLADGGVVEVPLYEAEPGLTATLNLDVNYFTASYIGDLTLTEDWVAYFPQKHFKTLPNGDQELAWANDVTVSERSLDEDGWPDFYLAGGTAVFHSSGYYFLELDENAVVSDGSGATYFNTLKTIAIHITGDAPAPGMDAVTPSPYQVLVDGKEVSFDVYAHRDTNGLTNYFKIRDLAYVLNGTPAQFNVTWDGCSAALVPNTPYEPNGSEMTAPFEGPQLYRFATFQYLEFVEHNGERWPLPHYLTTIKLGSGGYTYFKLREVGEYMGFNVSFIGGKIVINTDQPYDPTT